MSEWAIGAIIVAIVIGAIWIRACWIHDTLKEISRQINSLGTMIGENFDDTGGEQ